MKPIPTPSFDKVYWLRVVLGVLAGVSAERVFGTDYSNGLLIGLIAYLGSYYLARYVWFKGRDKEQMAKIIGKLYSTGVGTYVLLFLFTWILVFTLSSA